MLKMVAALRQSLNHIIFQREALKFQIIDGQLFEAIVSEILTDHIVKELIRHIRLAFQSYNYKAFKRQTLLYFVELLLKFINNPRHLSFMNQYIVDFQHSAFENLNFSWVNAKIFFQEREVILTIDLYNKQVLWWGQVVYPHLCQRCTANNSNRQWHKLILGAFSLLGCYNLFVHL